MVNDNNVDYPLFEVRSANLIVQPGEICFPGGGIESEDKNPQEAAIRETCEELGIKKENIDLIGPLDILVTPFESIISPFVARIHRYQDIRINTEEVESFFLVPVPVLFRKPTSKLFIIISLLNQALTSLITFCLTAKPTTGAQVPTLFIFTFIKTKSSGALLPGL